MHLDRLFGYLTEREEIRCRKVTGLPFPWTEDPILRSYKFTNVYREEDATSCSLRDIYSGMSEAVPEDLLLTAATFRYFGTSEFAKVIGPQSIQSWDPQYLKNVAKSRMIRKERVWTGAYVITNQGIAAPKEQVVVDYFLTPLVERAEEIVAVAQTTRRWEDTCKALMKLMGFGGSGFMAKETLVDLTYTNFWKKVGAEQVGFDFRGRSALRSLPEDWHQWTPIGPGACRGAARVMLGDVAMPKGSSSKPEYRRMAKAVIKDAYNLQSSYWPEDNPLLHPHDIQFGLCEFDKYERVRLGQGKPRSSYRSRK